jgi:NAD+ dependent glucose-6-phosphate dehydrogenase
VSRRLLGRLQSLKGPTLARSAYDMSEMIGNVMSDFHRIIITGAAGNLGAKLAAHLAGRHELVLLDKPDGDLSVWDERWVSRFEGIDSVVHLAGDPVAYHDWDELTKPNIDAVINVFEAAARAGVKRLIFASSNHVMGGYQDGEPIPITTSLPPKPGLRYFADGADRFSGAYAAAKLFGERLGQHYATTRGMEVIAVRIGWVWRGTNEPSQLPPERGEWFRKMWLSDRDFLHLMDCCLTAELPKPFVIVNGMSNNTGMRWDLTGTEEAIRYQPQDNVERE